MENSRPNNEEEVKPKASSPLNEPENDATFPSVQPPIIIQSDDNKRYFIEGFLIVFSVLLALFLNEIRNNWQEDRQTKELINNVRAEILQNKATVRAHYDYLTVVIHNIDSALLNENYKAELFEYGFFNLIAVAPEGVFNAGFINDVAWEIARSNNISSKVEFETMYLLTEIYKQQNMVNKGYETVSEFLNDRNTQKTENTDETLNLIKWAYRGLSYDRMPSLLISYDQALEKLEGY